MPPDQPEQTEHPLVIFARAAECSQDDIAREAGLSQAFVSRVVHRQRTPSPDVAVALQDACRRLARRRHRGLRKAPSWQQILERDDDGTKATG